jgi:hypothetical protein
MIYRVVEGGGYDLIWSINIMLWGGGGGWEGNCGKLWKCLGSVSAIRNHTVSRTIQYQEPYSIKNHAVSRTIQYQEPYSIKNRTVSRTIQYQEPCSIRNHTVSRTIQYQEPYSIRTMQYQEPCSIKNHTVSKTIQYQEPYSIKNHTVSGTTQYQEPHSIKNHTVSRTIQYQEPCSIRNLSPPPHLNSNIWSWEFPYWKGSLSQRNVGNRRAVCSTVQCLGWASSSIAWGPLCLYQQATIMCIVEQHDLENEGALIFKNVRNHTPEGTTSHRRRPEATSHSCIAIRVTRRHRNT